ncbi:MAG TPA: radical SAM protein [Elusimicrobiales bacterium]|nr:radical SAM protein [Elusimicrobiales bacterium]
MEPKAPIKLDWDIHYSCNYNCPYCWFHNQWGPKALLNVYPGTEKLIGYWRAIYDKCGRVQLSIGGGEPFTYPGFHEFVIECAKLHKIYVTTNLSGNPQLFAGKVDPANLSFAASLHPVHAKFEEFSAKAAAVKKAGFQIKAVLVAWPPFLKDMQSYKRQLNDLGLELEVHSFWGNFEGREYPDAYTKQERELLAPFLGSRSGTSEKFQLTPKATTGKLCRAGQVHASIYPNGDVVRCGGEGWKRDQRPFTNIFSEDFQLYKEPQPCRAIACPSNEWAEFLVEDAHDCD